MRLPWGAPGSFSRQVSLRTLRVKTAVHHFSRRGVVQLPTGLSKGRMCFRLHQCETERAKAGLGEKLPIAEVSPHENAVRESRFFRLARQALDNAVFGHAARSMFACNAAGRTKTALQQAGS